jgi:hypothetical protein
MTNKQQIDKALSKLESRKRYIVRRRACFTSAIPTAPSQKRRAGKSKPRQKGRQTATVAFEEEDPLLVSRPSEPYHISDTTKHALHIYLDWIAKNKDDAAMEVSCTCQQRPRALLIKPQDFHLDLKNFIYQKLTGEDDEDNITNNHRREIIICGDQLYRHKVLRVHYTTYDLRRCQDSINPRTHADIMVANPEDDPDRPYWYARVAGIFHVKVLFRSKVAQNINFLWVRWFGHDYKFKSGFKHRRLPRVGFVQDHQRPMGIIDPSTVIRAAHMIPGFHFGRTDIYLGPSIARNLGAEGCQPVDDDNEDWVYYYVNMYVLTLLFHNTQLSCIQIR